MRLIKAGLLRLVARRAIAALALLSMLGLSAVVVGQALQTFPPNADEISVAKEQAALERKTCEHEEAVESDRVGEPVEYNCEFYRAQDHLGYVPYDFASHTPLLLFAMIAGMALVSFLAAATFIGAEWSAGTVSQQLLFESRRARVFISKAVVSMIGPVIVAAISLGLALSALYGVATLWGSTSGVDTPQLKILAAELLRGLALVAASGLAAFALTALARHTAVAIGAVALYATGSEAIVRAIPNSAPWLLTSNVQAWVHGRLEIPRDECDALGACVQQVHILTMSDAALYLGLALATLVGISFLAFKRRDII